MKPGKGLKDKGKCEEGSSRGESRGLPGALETSWTLGDRKWSRQPRGWGGGVDQAACSHSGSRQPKCPSQQTPRAPAQLLPAARPTHPTYGPVPASFRERGRSSFRGHTCPVANGRVRRRKHAPACQASAPLWPRSPYSRVLGLARPQGSGRVPPAPPPHGQGQ